MDQARPAVALGTIWHIFPLCSCDLLMGSVLSSLFVLCCAHLLGTVAVVRAITRLDNYEASVLSSARMSILSVQSCLLTDSSHALFGPRSMNVSHILYELDGAARVLYGLGFRSLPLCYRDAAFDP